MSVRGSKLQSLEGFLWGCPICGGRRHRRLLTKRGRAREKRLWRKEEQRND